jgi:hypothetical protein
VLGNDRKRLQWSQKLSILTALGNALESDHQVVGSTRFGTKSLNGFSPVGDVVRRDK